FGPVGGRFPAERRAREGVLGRNRRREAPPARAPGRDPAATGWRDSTVTRVGQARPMASLHARGWRQGSVFLAALPLDAVVLGADGTPERRPGSHERWVVASQNCDLDTTDEESPDPTIEIRPIYTESPPMDWG